MRIGVATKSWWACLKKCPECRGQLSVYKKKVKGKYAYRCSSCDYSENSDSLPRSGSKRIRYGVIDPEIIGRQKRWKE